MAKKKENEIKITQVRSAIGRQKRQKETLRALGIRRINHSVVQKATPQILGMVNKVKHMVKVEEA
ncbi:MAG: 50S ribosomal protein L30 [Caldithrix sp.]|nr:50S ribosomal protein L30 [Caldithrix sp.]